MSAATQIQIRLIEKRYGCFLDSLALCRAIPGACKAHPHIFQIADISLGSAGLSCFRRDFSFALFSSRTNQLQFWKVRSESRCVARKYRTPKVCGMRADNKVGQHSRSISAAPSVH